MTNKIVTLNLTEFEKVVKARQKQLLKLYGTSPYTIGRVSGMDLAMSFIKECLDE